MRGIASRAGADLKQLHTTLGQQARQRHLLYAVFILALACIPEALLVVRSFIITNWGLVFAHGRLKYIVLTAAEEHAGGSYSTANHAAAPRSTTAGHYNANKD